MTTTIGSFDLASLKNLRDDVTQYFWFESDSSSAWGSGAHVTLYPESQFTDSTNPNYMKGQNIIMNTDGFSIRNGGLPMMVLDNNSLDFNVVDTTDGTYTTTATFTSTGAQIGRNESGYTMLKIDPTDSSGTGITEVFYIKASNDMPVQKVILDENYTRDGTVDKSFSDLYIGNGIGSYNSPLTTTERSATPVTYTISEIDNITDGEEFTLSFRVLVQNWTSSTEGTVGSINTTHTFTKASAGEEQTSSETWTATTPIQQMLYGYLQFTTTLTYDPSTSHVTIELSARVTQTSNNRVTIPTSVPSYFNKKTEIFGLTYSEADVMIPINQINGDLYACASQDVNGDYQPLGRLYVGVDAELGDVDLYDALDALGWAVPPIIV